MKKYLLSFSVLILFLLASCDPYQKVLKSTDTAYKYEKAKEYYNKGDYSKAIPLLEELITVYKGTKSIEDIYFYYAYSQYAVGNYLISAYHFKNLYVAYPTGQYAEESLYMTAHSYYRMSPRVDLEQTQSIKSIEAFQLFANTYPHSSRIGEVNKLMDEMRRKLEVKAFKAAQLYYNTRNYQAAAVAFSNFVKDYPSAREIEQAQVYILRSYFEWAEHSVDARKAERYAMAVSAFNQFSDRFPSSRFLKEAEQIKEQAVKQLAQYQTEETELTDL